MTRSILAPVLVAMLLAGNAAVSADLGDGLAAYQKRDFVTAAEVFAPLAQRGQAEAQYRLGDLFYHGLGVPQSYETAIDWWIKAADQAHAEARFALAAMYGGGLGVSRDDDKALSLYLLAAEQEHPGARRVLEARHAMNMSGPQDPEAAFRWHRYFAERGEAFDRFVLGLLYAEGKGVAGDRVRAHLWLSLAASEGGLGAEAELKKVRKRMSKADLAALKALTRRCLETRFKGC